ncbi:MAG: hypothetical protein A3J79_02395 [Elusimicrobia bacterium RIFOXYB2_FULL_62_6]|nr:MAG: hypothetical protein A3J79_02395 [Elusimicrobia bacterium RIFOXYB2_FULL_62_6]
MKKNIFAALILTFAGGAYCAEFSDLAVNASVISARAEAMDFKLDPAAVQLPEGQLAGAVADLGSKWYGADSRQARMQFTANMLYKIPAGYTGAISQVLSNPSQRQKITELVNLQLQHMYGAFTTHPGFVDNPGIPSGDYKVTLQGAQDAADRGPRYAMITYTYDDTVVFAKGLFQGGGATRIQFVLPLDPVTIYSKGFPSKDSDTNLCTDEHYNSEGDFWYFWNPYQEGCPISGDDLVAVQTDLAPLPVTHNTYPEYAKLYGNNGGGSTLQVSYLVGVDEGFSSGDLGKKTFQDAFVGLKGLGFKATADTARAKKLTLSAGGKTVVIDMQLMDPNSGEFAAEAVSAMKTADIFIYDGHSGLGGYLNPERLAADSGQTLTLPKNKYQIFVFQGCSTYAYYNSAFFQLKKSSSDPKGSKNLDIITTGIGAAFDVGAKVDVSFIKSVATGQRPSWQTILDNVRKAEGYNSALSHINGDEDNPKTPN